MYFAGSCSVQQFSFVSDIFNMFSDHIPTDTLNLRVAIIRIHGNINLIKTFTLKIQFAARSSDGLWIWCNHHNHCNHHKHNSNNKQCNNNNYRKGNMCRATHRSSRWLCQRSSKWGFRGWCFSKRRLFLQEMSILNRWELSIFRHASVSSTYPCQMSIGP